MVGTSSAVWRELRGPWRRKISSPPCTPKSLMNHVHFDGWRGLIGLAPAGTVSTAYGCVRQSFKHWHRNFNAFFPRIDHVRERGKYAVSVTSQKLLNWFLLNLVWLDGCSMWTKHCRPNLILTIFFWALVPYRFAGRYKRFGGSHCLHLQGLKWTPPW